MRPATLALLVLACLAQLAVPAWWIVAHERTLAEGTVWRFRTTPVDPYDPFRGRYVTLTFDVARVERAPSWLRSGDRVWAILGTDAEGFAIFERFAPEAPDGAPAVPVRVLYAADGEANLQLPFSRWYLPEDLAPRVEAEWGRLSWDPERVTWAEVRVLGGNAVVEDLFVDGRPIRELVADPP